MVNFEVSLVVNEVVLLVFGVVVDFEVGGDEVLPFILPLLSDSPLLILQPVFLFGCLDHVAVLQVALVRATTRVSRCHRPLQP